MNFTRARITKDGIRIYEDADFAGMREAGRIAAQILDDVEDLVKPGATTGQIEEFIREYNGEGIQHLALTTGNIYETVEKLRARGVRLQDTIETYEPDPKLS